MNAAIRKSTTVTATAVAVVVALAGEVFDLVIGDANRVDVANAVSSALAVTAFLLVGAVLSIARRENRVGWFMLVGAVGWSLGNAAIEVSVYGTLTRPGTVGDAAIYSTFGEAARAAGWAFLVVAVAVVFPDGHLAGPRWRWLGRVTGIAIGLLVLAQILAPTLEETRLAGRRNPIGLPMPWDHPTSLMALVGTGLLSLSAIGSVIELVGRWRSGGPLMRQQLIVFSVAICLPALVPLVLITGSIPSWLFGVSVLPLAIAIAVAVLQHRFYDLHFAVNRTLLWLGLSGAVIAIYVLIIGGVGGLLDASGARWLPWVATGVVAVSFAPLRSALQAAVNRITYGRWEQPYDVLADIGQRLEEAADTGRLLDSVADELTGSLGLPGVVIRGLDGTILVQRGDLGPEPAQQALIAYGETVGTLAYARGRATRTSDARLLEDLARQLGGVLHAGNLVSALQQTRERLVLTREEERRRLRRDLHDGVGPALAGLILKVDTIGNVLPSHVDAQPARERLRLLREDVQATVLDVRRVVEGLRPPALDELGLAAALHQATARLAAGAQLTVTVHVPEMLPPLPAAVEVAAFRIAVEATTNAVRHAGAQTCTITLAAVPGRLLVNIADDGGGIGADTAATSGNGMATMRERAEELGGTMTVRASSDGTVSDGSVSDRSGWDGSVPGGTVITAVLPLGMSAPAMAGPVVAHTAEGS